MDKAARSTDSDISVVIPTVGRSLLAGCLRSLLAGRVWPTEVVVVDQSDNREVDEWISEVRAAGMSARRIGLSTRGIARATNAGLKSVRSPWVAVTHDDCEVAPNWIEILSERAKADEDSVITGRVEGRGDGIVATVKESLQPARYRRPLLNEDVLFPLNMAFPIRILRRVGYFDEHPSLALAGEDNDWSHRLLRSGISVVYDPMLVVHHIAWQRQTDLYQMYRRYAYGQGAFYGKHLRRRDLLILVRTVRDVIRAPWLLLRGLATRNSDLIAMARGELLGLIPGILAGIRRNS
jgi:GT2 family glycosyltransferase